MTNLFSKDPYYRNYRRANTPASLTTGETSGSGTSSRNPYLEPNNENGSNVFLQNNNNCHGRNSDSNKSQKRPLALPRSSSSSKKVTFALSLPSGFPTREGRKPLTDINTDDDNEVDTATPASSFSFSLASKIYDNEKRKRTAWNDGLNNNNSNTTRSPPLLATSSSYSSSLLLCGEKDKTTTNESARFDESMDDRLDFTNTSAAATTTTTAIATAGRVTEEGMVHQTTKDGTTVDPTNMWLKTDPESKLVFTLSANEATTHCSLILRHDKGTDEYIAFKVKATHPRRYLFRSIHGLLAPGCSETISISLMEKDKQLLLSSYERLGQSGLDHLNDRFLVQSCTVDKSIAAGVDHLNDQFLAQSCTVDESFAAKMSESQAELRDALTAHWNSVTNGGSSSATLRQNFLCVRHIADPSSNIHPPSVATTLIGDVDINTLKEGVMGYDPSLQFECMIQFRQLLSEFDRGPPLWIERFFSSNTIEKNAVRDIIIDSGVVRCFVEFLQRYYNPELQFEAAWALTNIAAGTSDHTKVVTEAGAVPILVGLLLSPNDDIREQAVWALGNIAVASPLCRDLVLQAKAMPRLLQQCHPHSKLSMLNCLSQTLCKVFTYYPQPDLEIVRSVLPTLSRLISSSDDEVLTDASEEQNEMMRQALIDADVDRQLVELLSHPSPVVQMPALLTNCIRKAACWTIANITAGNSEQIQAVVDNNIIPPLIQLLTNAEFKIRNEAGRAISNAGRNGTCQQVKGLVDQGCIRPLFTWLADNGDNRELFSDVIGSLNTFIEIGRHGSMATGQSNVFEQQLNALFGEFKACFDESMTGRFCFVYDDDHVE